MGRKVSLLPLLLPFLATFLLAFHFCPPTLAEGNVVGTGTEQLEAAEVPFPNNQLAHHGRVKRNTGHAIKSFGITILALVGASVLFGIDYSITTIFTPLVIITLTKNVDIKAILDTCNYRRQQHLARQDGRQHWAKALTCWPTEDEEKVHKRRLFLDVMKVAFQHTNAKTMLLIQKEFDKYKALTRYMDESTEWNAPKTSRTLLLFFANHGLIEPDEENALPPFIPEEQFRREMDEGMAGAFQQLNMQEPEFLKEEVARAEEHLRGKEGAGKRAEAVMDGFRKQVDQHMGAAEKQVLEEYRAKSLKHQIGHKLSWVAKQSRRLMGWAETDGEKKKMSERKEQDEAYLKYMKRLSETKDEELSIVEKVDKYGLLNYEVVDRKCLEQLTRDLAFGHGTLVRWTGGEASIEDVLAIAAHLWSGSELDVEKEAELNLEPDRELGEERNAKMEEGKGRQGQAKAAAHFFLDPAKLEEYPKLLQQVMRKTFEEEMQKLGEAEKLAKELEEGEGGKGREVGEREQHYLELYRMPAKVKKFYLQYGLVRSVAALLKPLFARYDAQVQKYYTQFLFERKTVKELFSLFRIKSAQKLALELRWQIYQEMEKAGKFAEFNDFLSTFKLKKEIESWWVELPPGLAFAKIEGRVIGVCKGPASKDANHFTGPVLGHRKMYKKAEECAEKIAKPLMERYEEFLWLSNQYRVRWWKAGEKADKSEQGQEKKHYEEAEEAIGRVAGEGKEQGPLEMVDGDEQKVSAILDLLIAEQRREFEVTTLENVGEQAKEQLPVSSGAEGREQPGQEHVRRKRFVFSTVLINILRTASWMQLFKHFNIIEIVRDCVVRSINFRQWGCDYPSAIKAEQNFIYKLKRIVMEEMSCGALPKIRQIYDDFVRKHAIGRKRPSPSELLAEADLVIPFRWEDMLNGYSHQLWKRHKEYFLRKCEEMGK